ncbi:hypothetical protein MP228_000570 [Amoeboaphelidium protococcarum]|nr:hypothetical protein MP228_000570 [Amoeboaphelidium protococcarum]
MCLLLTNVDSKLLLPTVKALAQTIESLNDGQRNVFDLVHPKLDLPAQPGNCLYIKSGKAGYGKTYLYKVLYNYARLNARFAASLATNGLAIFNLSDAQTVHPFFVQYAHR